MNYIKTHQPCPDCGSTDALCINEDGSTFCFSCERRKGAEEMDIEVGVLEDIEDFTVPALTEGIVKSIADRGITKSTCRAYGVTQLVDTHLYPYHDQDGVHVANKKRVGDKTFRTEGSFDSATLFGQNNFSKGGKYITICEGELDALSAYQMLGSKWPVLSISTGAQSAVKDIERSFEYLSTFDNIVICFDNDTVGHKAAKSAAELLSPKAKIVRLKLKDANEYLSEGREKDFVQAWWNAETYTPEGIIAGTDLWPVLQEGPAETAVTYPFDGLNRMTYGIRLGELVTICAGTGIGKSSFLRELVKHIFDNTEDNIGLMFMEETVRTTAESLMSLEMNVQLHLPDLVYEDQAYEDAYNNTVGSGRYFFFDHFGSNSIDNILARIRYFVKAAKCKYIVLDHISILVSSQEHTFDERKTIDECMTKLRTLVQELNICLLMVSHLRRPMQGSHEEGRSTSLSDLRGSASIGQLSDIVIGLERNGQADCPIERHTTYARVIKNRFCGLTGLSTKLFYDFTTGRIREKNLELEDED